MQKNEIRWGLLGCGAVTEKKSGPAFARIPGSRIEGVMSRNLSRAESWARRNKVPFFTEDAQALIDHPDIQAIYIATPPSSHKALALATACAGKPAYIEKPLATTLADAEAIVTAFQCREIPLFTAYYRRALPHFLRMRSLLNRAILGELLTAEIRYQRPPLPCDLNPAHLPWRLKPEISGGGYLFDLAPHHLDMLSYLFHEVRLMDAVHENREGLYDAEDYTFARFLLNGKIESSALWNFASESGMHSDVFRITGTKGWMEIPFFSTGILRMEIQGRKREEVYHLPDTIQEPLITRVVKELRGERNSCPSTGVTALEANRLLDEITGKLTPKD